MRMAELARRSGIARETIHYYLREGLLPPPERKGKTSAFYDDSHLERLRLIRRLRDEKYLPVAVIRSMFEAGLEVEDGADLDTLADVLRLGRAAEPCAGPDAETARVAAELGLIDAVAGDDPSQRRVLAAIGEALDLEGGARELTLEDMRVSGRRVSELVAAEAHVFFDFVVEHGDMVEGVKALRAGRPAVARFIAAYRDLMLRRIVDDLLAAIRGASERVQSARALPLGPKKLAQLGAEQHRVELLRRAKRGDPSACNDYVWHCFSVGPTRELSRLPRSVAALLRPRAELLVAHARLERESGDLSELERISSRAGAFPLGEVLAAERALLDALEARPGTSLLERAVPALHRLFCAEPGSDADPLASALAYLRRGLIGFALPAVLGRGERTAADLSGALRVVLSAPGRVHPAARARIEGNARLVLGRQLAAQGLSDRAREELARARDVDPAGPIGLAASSALGE
jgi:DNA-binding transcriptional MerR regulator